MLISSHGKADKGFATLDALIAILILTLALTALSAWSLNLTSVSEQRRDTMEALFRQSDTNELLRWYYETESNGN